MATDEPLNWVFTSGLGERDPANVTDQDMLTSLKFDKTGDYLALGDKAGRVIIFQHSKGKKSRVEDYDYFSEFQSHESTYDYLKSCTIDEKINSLEWVNNNHSSLQILSTNDKDIKLWKMRFKEKKEYKRAKVSGNKLNLPDYEVTDEDWEGMCRKTFTNPDVRNKNCLSLLADGENFLSTDDFGVNLHNLENELIAYNLFDLKDDSNMSEEDQNREVITSCKAH